MRAFLLTSLFAVAFGSRQHLVCETIDDLSSSTDDLDVNPSSRRLQGPPGKRGIPGARGKVGLPGPPGPQTTVDYQRITGAINEKIQRDLDRIYQTMVEKIDTRMKRGLKKIKTKFEELLSNFTKIFHPLDKRCTELTGLFYNGVCYVIIMEKMNYTDGIEKCRSLGGLLAEIYDRQHQSALDEYVSSNSGSEQDIDISIGMTYHPPLVRYRSGKEISNTQFDWHSSFPSVTERNWRMGMEVHKDRNHDDGLWNYDSAASMLYVLCEITD